MPCGLQGLTWISPSHLLYLSLGSLTPAQLTQRGAELLQGHGAGAATAHTVRCRHLRLVLTPVNELHGAAVVRKLRSVQWLKVPGVWL